MDRPDVQVGTRRVTSASYNIAQRKKLNNVYFGQCFRTHSVSYRYMRRGRSACLFVMMWVSVNCNIVTLGCIELLRGTKMRSQDYIDLGVMGILSSFQVEGQYSIAIMELSSVS